MTKITILGAGITGMAIASQLPRHHEITIVARNLPGDEPHSQEWASPWAGAVWTGMDGSTPREQQFQLNALAVWWKLALSDPESSVRRIEMNEYRDTKTLDQIWFAGKVPEFRVIPEEDRLPGTTVGFKYRTIVLTPMVFLPWLRSKLEATGVKFQRTTVRSLADLKGIGHDILINAAGIGPLRLEDVKDTNVQEVRGQTILVKSKFGKLFVRNGHNYTYAFARGDGTTVLGGIKQFGSTETQVNPDIRTDIIRRVHQSLPDDFPSPDPKDYTIVRDIVGIRPQREGGVRVERETLDGQKVVHAYGVAGGGYVFSFGVGKEVARLVDDGPSLFTADSSRPVLARVAFVADSGRSNATKTSTEAQRLCEFDDVVGPQDTEHQAESLFLNTTWNDFELCRAQEAPENKKNLVFRNDSVHLRTPTDWTGAYANRMCPGCRLVDGDRNRYRQIIIPISLVSPLVLRSVLALAANQLKHYDNKFKVTALHYQSTTLQLLSQTIASASRKDQASQQTALSNLSLSKTEMLAIILMLCHSEFSNDIAYRPGFTSAWRAHLDGARRILELPTPGPSGEGAGVITFLGGFLASHSVLAYTTLVNPHDAEFLFRGGTYWLTKIARPPQEIDNYTNCSTELLSIILETCHRVRHRRNHKSLNQCSSLRAWKRETQARLLHLIQFHVSIQPLSSPITITAVSNPITEYPPPIPTVNRTAEAFRHAALILLQYLDTDYPFEKNSMVKESVTILLSLMNAGVPIPPPGKSGRSVFLWPYFIAACHVQIDEDRAVVLKNLHQLERIAATVDNNAVQYVREVIEGVWKQRDLRGDRTSISFSAKGGCFCALALGGDHTDKDEPCFEWEVVMRSLRYAFDWA
ncbi:uncharacterized protein KD926_010961 [Aspergillus affinis]|uniref:uncharacterized protein n=1 Tax=Aspergillus affinis TaxID=1070780 RepID=UPI0022FEEBEF|nr:uncharacterized protein KD926_010961 [Aspergillus affinis]KAI9038305.1 hypothetical protein KD926_010961 [Aspergillus affinis]